MLQRKERQMNMGDHKQTVPQVGRNPTVDSDRVEAPMVGAGPMDSGGGQSHITGTECGGDKHQEPFKPRKSLIRSPTISNYYDLTATEPETSDGELFLKELSGLRRISVGRSQSESEREERKRKKAESSPTTDIREGQKKKKSLANQIEFFLENMFQLAEDLSRNIEQNTSKKIKELSGRMHRQTKKLQKENIIQWLRKQVDQCPDTANASTQTSQKEQKSVTISTQTFTKEEWEVDDIRQRIDEATERSNIIKLAREKWQTSAYFKTKTANGNPLKSNKENVIFIDPEDYNNNWLGRALTEENPHIKNLIDAGKLKKGKIATLRTNIQIEEDEDGEQQNVDEKTISIIGIDSGNNSQEEETENADRLFANCKQLIGKLTQKKISDINIGVATRMDINFLRNILEILLNKVEMKATLYLGRTRLRNNTTTGEPESVLNRQDSLSTEKWKSETVHLKALTENSTAYANALKKMKSDLNLEKLGIRILRQEKQNDGTLKLKIAGKTETSNSLFKQEMSKSLNGIAKVDKIIKKKQVLIRDLSWDTTTNDIKEAMERELKIPSENFEVNISQKENNKGLKYAILTMTIEDASAALQSRRLAVKWDRCRVQEMYKPARCYKCYKIGHYTGECKEKTQAEARCLRCNNPGHTAKECVNKPFCKNCNCEGHRDDSMACPNYRNFVKKMKIENTKNGY